MKTIALLLISLSIAPFARAQAGLETDQKKTLYALGTILGQRITSLGLTADEVASVTMGLKDAALGNKLAVDLPTFGPKIEALAQERLAKHAAIEKESAKAFIAKAQKEKGAKTLPSGVVYIERSKGSGDSPKPEDRVKLHYTGTLRDGSVFDSSRNSNPPKPAEFPLAQVIPCMSEGLQKMKVGGKARFVCPPDTAYGDGGRPGIPGGAALSFEIELLGILK